MKLIHKFNDAVSTGNALADHAAKAAAKIGILSQVKLCPSIGNNSLAFSIDVPFIQERTDVEEQRLWFSHGCK